LDEHLRWAFPANTFTPFQRLHSLAFSFGTFAYAKDRASLLHDGMLEESPTPCSSELFGVNDQPVAARERYSGFFSTSLLLLIFCSYKIQIVNEDENQLPSCKPLFSLFSNDAPFQVVLSQMSLTYIIA